MAKAIVFTDVHISKNGAMMRGGKSRLSYVEDSVEYICEYAKSRGIKLAINCGDLTSSDTLNAEEMSTLVKVLTKLGDTFEKTYHVLGNHEKKDINGEFTSVESIDLARGNTLIKHLETTVIGNTPVMFVPYTESIDEVREFLDKTSTPPRFTFSHLTLTPAGEFFKGLDTSVFKECGGNVFNGHIHNPSEFDGNIINIGSLLGSNFSDDYSIARPGFIVIDLNDPGTYTRVENLSAPLYYQVSSLDEIPKDAQSRSYVKLTTSDTSKTGDGLAGLAINLESSDGEFKKVDLGDKGVYEALGEFYEKMPKHRALVAEVM